MYNLQTIIIIIIIIIIFKSNFFSCALILFSPPSSFCLTASEISLIQIKGFPRRILAFSFHSNVYTLLNFNFMLFREITWTINPHNLGDQINLIKVVFKNVPDHVNGFPRRLLPFDFHSNIYILLDFLKICMVFRSINPWNLGEYVVFNQSCQLLAFVEPTLLGKRINGAR